MIILWFIGSCHGTGGGRIYVEISSSIPPVVLSVLFVTGSGRKQQPLMPIAVNHPFQIIGVDIMELPLTTNGNRHAIVFHKMAVGLCHTRPKNRENS